MAGEVSTNVRVARWIISGRVQGVGFRFYVERQASRLGLSGWVRNSHGGSVEVEASGTEESLKILEQYLRSGPALAHVDNVERADIPHEPGHSNLFIIK